jgi:inositol-1,4,5-trisphosphate 5-phosphatase
LELLEKTVYLLFLNVRGSFGSDVMLRSFQWVQKIKDLLKPLDYLVAKTEQMQGLLMAIFVKRKHLYHIREIEGEYTRTGFGGMWVS